MGKLFGTDGVRGVVNKELTPEIALRLGKAIGSYFGKGSRILVGRDVRAGGDMLMKALESGLLSTGVKVFEGGLAPTPALQYAVKTLGYDGGVIITASHNPPEYNGIKVISDEGIEVSRDVEELIEEFYFSEKFLSREWSELFEEVKREDNVIPNYIRGILSHIDKEKVCSKNFRVLIDPANSVGALTTPIIARELCCKYYVINGNLDPYFPARLPEPTNETLQETAMISKSLGVELGVAHDGDADRAIFIDSLGRIQWGDRSGTLLSEYAWEKERGSKQKVVVTAVSSSGLVEEYLSPKSFKIIWTPVGSIGIAYKVKQENGAAGFEENGGFIYPQHQFVRDGGMTFALMLELLAMERISSAELFDRLPKYYPIKTKIPLSKVRDINKLYDKLIQTFGNKGNVITIDGVKVIGKDFWFLVRKSGTEPIVRIMIEAKEVEFAQRLLSEIQKLAMEEN